MTQTEMMNRVRMAGCTVRVEDGEIRVVPRGGGEFQAYYTNDRDDAVRTAQRMGGLAAQGSR